MDKNYTEKKCVALNAIFQYIYFLLKSFFKPSFRPSGPGSAACCKI